MGGVISSRTPHISHGIVREQQSLSSVTVNPYCLQNSWRPSFVIESADFCADERSLTLGRVRWINDLKTLDLLFGEPGDPSVNTKTTTIPGFIRKMGVKQLKKMLADFNVAVPKSIVNKSELQELLANTMAGHGSSDTDSGKVQDTSLLKRVPS